MPILTDDERIGSVVGGGYRLDRILGRGGMGVVYAATHARVPELRVAVKFLNATYAQNAEVVERFMREARAAAMLKHPNVVAVTDVGVSEDGAPYMMLEFLDGQPLSGLIEERGAVSPQELMSYLGPVMAAVAFAHDSGIVHRDIKPDNIFLSRTGQGHVVPKVLDFGIAKLTRDQSKASGGTVAGGVLGTPTYMAPEQAQGENVGPWSDVWSMGVVFYEALSGAFPWDFSGKSDVLQVLTMVMTEAPKSLATRRSSVPTPIVEVVDRALTRDPRKRFRHMRELDEAMKAAIGRVSMTDTLEPGRFSQPAGGSTPFVSSSIRPPGPSGPRSIALPIAGGVSVVGLLIAIGVGASVFGGSGAPPATTMTGSTTTEIVHAAGAPVRALGTDELALPPEPAATTVSDAGAPPVSAAPLPAGADTPGPAVHTPGGHHHERGLAAPTTGQPATPPPPTTSSAAPRSSLRTGAVLFDPSELDN